MGVIKMEKIEHKKSNIEDKINEHPEIKEAIEAMERIRTVENNKAKDLYKREQVYILLK